MQFHRRLWVAFVLLAALAAAQSADRLARVEALAKEGRFVEAYELARKVASGDPKNVAALLWLGDTAQKNGNLAEAVAAYQRAIVLRPDSAEALLGAGDIHQQQEKWAKAIEAYEKVIALKPELSAPHSSLGDVYRKNGAWARAVRHYRKAIELDPKDALSQGYLEACERARGEQTKGSVTAGTFRSLARVPAEVRQRGLARDLKPPLAAGPAEAGTIPFQIPFPRDKFAVEDLTEAARKQLDEVAQALQSEEWKSRRPLVVEGHACSCGAAAFNRELGRKRASAVRQYLAGKGAVQPGEITVFSFGKSNPIAPGAPESLPFDACQRDEAHTQNRRVVIKHETKGATAQVQFLFRPAGQGEFRPLTNSETLRNKDEVQIQIEPFAGVSAYVFHKGSGGDWASLFPNPAVAAGMPPGNPLAPGRKYWIPGETSGLVLDETPGTEETYVCLSPGPDPVLDRLARKLREETAAVASTKSRPKPAASKKTEPPKSDVSADGDPPPRQDPVIQQSPGHVMEHQIDATDEVSMSITTRGFQGVVRARQAGNVFLKVRSCASVKFEHKP